MRVDRGRDKGELHWNGWCTRVAIIIIIIIL